MILICFVQFTCIFTIIGILGTQDQSTFIFNNTLNFLNRQVFVRNYDPIYVCPTLLGWVLASSNLFEELLDNNTLKFTKKTAVGLYLLKCGDREMVVEIIDASIINIILSPQFPYSLPRGEDVIFRVIFQPFSMNVDKTYGWRAYQTSGDGRLRIETKNDLMIIHLDKSVSLGSYTIDIRFYNKIRRITFNITKEVIQQRMKVDFLDKRDTVDSLTGLNKFFLSLVILGFTVSVLSTFVYICAISCTERNRMIDISGHKNLIVEEELLMEDTDKQCYKIMENPMNREKDVEMILEKAREMQKEFSAVRSDLPGSQSKAMTYPLFRNNPFGLSQDEMKLLQEKFPEGVCLNCVKLASQILLLNKEDCPGVHHVCNDESCANHGQIRCQCAELQTNPAAPKTFNLFSAITGAKKCYQLKGKNNNNVNVNYQSKPKYTKNGYRYLGLIHSSDYLEGQCSPNTKTKVAKLTNVLRLISVSSSLESDPKISKSKRNVKVSYNKNGDQSQIVPSKDSYASQRDTNTHWMPVKATDVIPRYSTWNIFQRRHFPSQQKDGNMKINQCLQPCQHICQKKSVPRNMCACCRCCRKKRI